MKSLWKIMIKQLRLKEILKRGKQQIEVFFFIFFFFSKIKKKLNKKQFFYFYFV